MKKVQSLLFVAVILAALISLSPGALAQQLEILDCSTGTYLGVAGAFDCAASTGGSTSYSIIAAPSVLNPVTTNDTASSSIHDHVFGTFFSIYSLFAGGTNGTVPQTASIIEVSEDASAVTYTFRDGLQYSDGSEWSMDDIIYWFEDVVKNPNLPNSSIDGFTCASDGQPFTYEALSATQLRVSCSDPFRTFTGAAGAGFVLSKQMALDLIEDQSIATEEGVNGPRARTEFMGLGADLELFRGLGPYTLEEFDSQSFARFERNPFFYEVDSNGTQLPYLDELEVVIIPTAGQNLALSNFLAGQTDVLGPRPADIAPILGQAAGGGFQVNADINNGSAAGGTAWVTINYDDENEGLSAAARNTNVRRALSLAIDRVAAVNNVLLGIGSPQYFPIGLTAPTVNTFFLGRNNTCATFAPLDVPCDDATGLMTVRTGLELQVGLTPPYGLNEALDQHLQCLVDFDFCVNLANDMLDAEGYTDTDGDGIRNLTDGSNWRIQVATNSGNTIREGYTQIVCDGWVLLGIDCSAISITFNTLVAQLQGTGGATWTGGIVLGLTGNDPAGNVNVLKCGAPLHFYHLSCDPDATSGPTSPTDSEIAVEDAFDTAFAATNVPDAQESFDAMQLAFIENEPYMEIAIPNALFAVRTDRLCNDGRAINGFDDVKYRIDVPGNQGTCSSNVGR